MVRHYLVEQRDTASLYVIAGREEGRYLQLSEGVGVVSQAQGVEGAARVGGGIRALAEGAAVGTVHLSAAHEDDLQ